MRIALVAQDAQLTELSRLLAGYGHKVTVYTRKQHASQPARLSTGGVRVIPLGPAAADDPLDGMSAFTGQLRAAWAKNRPDVVHAVRWDSGLAALAAVRDLGIPLVQAFGSLGVAEQRHRLALGAVGTARIRLEPAIGRSASAVLAANSDEAADLAQLGVPRSSVRVIPCGIDTDEFSPDGPVAARRNRPRLLTMADSAERAGIGALLRVLCLQPDAELIVAGGAAP